ncbi:hypothetical protein GQR58_025199 [Nymphon striatum]|nr:hypothetical protein GQR58_025199 [Nymphon striatum]
MIQNNKVMLVSSVQDLYEAEYCSLGGREDDIAVYSIQALTRKLKDTFEDKILLSNYTKRQGNFLYSSSMSKVDARARFHGDEVKSKLQDMIRSTALHFRSLIHAIPKWKTPIPTSIQRNMDGRWKMVALFVGWFDGPVIPADLFHDKEDTDVETEDQQAVDDAEYDDGSSTDSEWSDDSVESDSD